MIIEEYKLSITFENNKEVELVYRGNENIIITSNKVLVDNMADHAQITFPRYILKKFIEIIG